MMAASSACSSLSFSERLLGSGTTFVSGMISIGHCDVSPLPFVVGDDGVAISSSPFTLFFCLFFWYGGSCKPIREKTLFFALVLLDVFWLLRTSSVYLRTENVPDTIIHLTPLDDTLYKNSKTNGECDRGRRLVAHCPLAAEPTAFKKYQPALSYGVRADVGVVVSRIERLQRCI